MSSADVTEAEIEALARAYCQIKGIDPDAHSASDPSEGHSIDGYFASDLYGESSTRPWRYAWRIYRIEGLILARAAAAVYHAPVEPDLLPGLKRALTMTAGYGSFSSETIARHISAEIARIEKERQS